MKTKNNRYQGGYTLVELLMVIVVLVVIGGIITSILVGSLRGSNRSASVNDVRQSGNYVLIQMSKMIAYAKVFDGVSTDGSDTDYQTGCVPSVPPPATPTPIPSYSYIKITSFDGGTTVFSCSNGTIASNSSSMVDLSEFQVSNCYFTCEQQAASQPIIDINFTLNKITNGFFVENKISIPFGTSVVPRNANQ